jgi:DNA-binding NarL/FixJ family response regulator
MKVRTRVINKPIRLLLIDDHPVLRAGLVNMLRYESDMAIAGEAGSGEAALSLCESCRPNVCLLDLNMPGLGGIETIRRIRGIVPTMEIVVLTSTESAEQADRALAAGASAYVTKSMPYPEIVSVIRRVHAGQRGIRKGVAAAGARPPAAAVLSMRESEVLALIRSGKTTTEMSRELGIVERTVKFHVTSIFDKLGVNDRTAAVIKGFELGLLQVRPEEHQAPLAQPFG